MNDLTEWVRAPFINYFVSVFPIRTKAELLAERE